jgi:hypothetical protein
MALKIFLMVLGGLFPSFLSFFKLFGAFSSFLDRFCYVCEAGLDPATLPCELCNYTSGAYKRCTKGNNKWAHPLCASWIPEVYEVALPGKQPYLNLERLDMKRYKLKCGLCNKKGACVQCAYGRCTQAMHPYCALRSTVCTRRIIKGDEGILLWEIFCKSHATAVSDPPKHRPKAKSSRPLDDALDNRGSSTADDMGYWSTNGLVENSNHPFQEEKSSSSSSSKKDSYWANTNTSLNFKENRYLVGNNEIIQNTVQQLLTELTQQELSKVTTNSFSSSSHHHSSSSSSASCISLLEWPGMSEGETMDLDHFWNYISSFYIEDHNEEVIETCYECVKQLKPEQDDGNNNSSNGEMKESEELEDQIEDVLSSLGGEREKAFALNEQKRLLFLSRVYDLINHLQKKQEATNLSSSSSSSNTEDLTVVENDNDDHLSPITLPVAVEDNSNKMRSPSVNSSVGLTENQFYEMPLNREEDEEKELGEERVITNDNLNIVFDGKSNRIGCEFIVTPNYFQSSSRDIDPAKETQLQFWSEQNLIPLRPSVSSLSSSSTLNENNFELKLKQLYDISSNSTISLFDRLLRSKNDLTELALIIQKDSIALSQLSFLILKEIQLIQNNKKNQFHEMLGKYDQLQLEWKDINLKYMNQQIWKRIGQCIAKGIHDQNEEDFNKVSEDESFLPPSWALQVDGRPKAGMHICISSFSFLHAASFPAFFLSFFLSFFFLSLVIYRLKRSGNPR